jgi:hypothetical protein
MRKCVRGSVFALAAALAVATAYAAWRPTESLRAAKLAAPQVAADSIVAAVRAGDAPAERNGPDPSRREGAFCGLAGCVDALAAEGAELCLACIEPADLTQSGLDRFSVDGPGALFTSASLGGFAFGFGADPNPLYLIGLAPSAMAAPTPEISTTAMLTLGFAGVAWTARRARRRALRTRLRLAIATLR